MGVGDLTVPKRMQKFGEAFYGRSAAYDRALQEGAEPLAQALCKNILDGGDIGHARQLAAYADAVIAALAGLDDASVGNGSWRFPSPAQFAARGVSKVSSMMDRENPWSVPVVVAQIPDTGMHRDIDTNPGERSALADLGGLREVMSAAASLDLAPMRQGRVHVTGRVKARIGQTCVVTLDPIESDIDEAIDLIFAPPEQIPALADLVDERRDKRCRNSRSAGADRGGDDRSRAARDRCVVPGCRSLSAQARARFSSRRRFPPIPRIIRSPRSKCCGATPIRRIRRSRNGD